MKCNNCYGVIPDDSKVCPRCGKDILIPVSKKLEDVKVEDLKVEEVEIEVNEEKVEKEIKKIQNEQKRINEETKKNAPKEEKRDYTKIFKVISNILAFAGVLFIAFGLYNINEEKSHTKDYSNTTGYLVNQYCDKSSCYGTYQYNVDKHYYKIIYIQPNDDFKKQKTIYYNPSDPKISTIKKEWSQYIIYGGIILIINIAINLVTKLKKKQ